MVLTENKALVKQLSDTHRENYEVRPLVLQTTRLVGRSVGQSVGQSVRCCDGTARCLRWSVDLASGWSVQCHYLDWLFQMPGVLAGWRNGIYRS